MGYAEKTAQDWNKVIEHCEIVESMGFKLVDDYAQMWAYDDNDAVRNTTESIFEVAWTDKASGHWIWMMYHRNAYNPDDSYSWIKWITPSRSLIAAYELIDTDGRLWCGHGNGEFSVYEDYNFSKVHVPEVSSPIKDMCFDDKGNIWALAD